ncbi:MAG TPA: hypothetical protein VNL77_23290 [Roseiflexaceae bacterium]|nr:hypothetical protein [Roseiflexaceae bacterium]
MTTPAPELRWTSADLEAFPDNGKRYEIIDGELYVSKQPDWYHHQHNAGAWGRRPRKTASSTVPAR